MKILSFDIGTVNLAYCYLNYDQKIHKINIIEWNIINLKKQTNGSITPISLINLIQNKYKYFNSSDVILIENQSPQNSQMRIIQTILHTYFYTYDILENNTSNHQKVYICNPKDKYKDYVFEGKNTYYERKKASIVMATEYLTEICTNNAKNTLNEWIDNKQINKSSFYDDNDKNTQFLRQFVSYKKKDDLADSLLQIKAWICTSKLI